MRKLDGRRASVGGSVLFDHVQHGASCVVDGKCDYVAENFRLMRLRGFDYLVKCVEDLLPC
jgi:hypothetical protein